jgi:hypothetical protein
MVSTAKPHWMLRDEHKETEVVQVALPHNPGELARTVRTIATLASRLGNANIKYASAGVDPGTNVPLIFLPLQKSSAQQKSFTKPLPPREAV